MFLGDSIFGREDFRGVYGMSLWSGAGQRLVGFGVCIQVTSDVLLGAESAFSLVICGCPTNGFFIGVLGARLG